ncbi:MAG: hypothetical protein N2595_06955 [bacterium]|nr:hypothetical protein [bacterium]
MSKRWLATLSFVVGIARVLSADECRQCQSINPAYGMARGFGNLMSGWLELPRGLIYENARIPLVGFVVGPVKGCFLTAWRTLAGATDVTCMGLTGKGLYTREVPDFVWDARWFPGAHEYTATAGEPSPPPCRHVTKPVRVLSHSPEPCVSQPPHLSCQNPTNTTIVTEEIKLIEWTSPTRDCSNASLRAAHVAPASSSPVAARAAPSPRRKVRVTIPFDLGPADDTDRRIKALDARIAEIERRAGIWR